MVVTLVEYLGAAVAWRRGVASACVVSGRDCENVKRGGR